MSRRPSISITILSLLASGFVIGSIRSKKQRKILYQEADIEWHSIDRKRLNNGLEHLRLHGLVRSIKQANNRETIQLTQKGKARLLQDQLTHLQISPKKKWDKRWRMVMYDIPENRKTQRDALRKKLKELGFLEFQKSAFVYPFPCYKEVNFVINFFDLEDYAYCIDAYITPDTILRKKFGV